MHLYRHVLRKSWHLAWKNKFLWFFGFFAALLGANGNYDTVVQAAQAADVSVGLRIPYLSFFLEQEAIRVFTPRNLAVLAQNEPFNFLMFTVLFILSLGIIALLVWIVIISIGAIIYAAGKMEAGEKTDFREAFRAGRTEFWKILSVYLITKIAVAIVLFIISVPLYFLIGYFASLNGVVFVLAFLAMITLAIIAAFLAVLSSAFIIIKRQGIMESLDSAWKLFQKNRLICFETAFILLLVNILLWIIFVVGLSLISLPITLFVSAAGGIGGTSASLTMIAIGVIIFLAAIIIFGAFASVFQFSSWTILFTHLEEPQQSKLGRVALKIKEISKSYKK